MPCIGEGFHAWESDNISKPCPMWQARVSTRTQPPYLVANNTLHYLDPKIYAKWYLSLTQGIAMCTWQN